MGNTPKNISASRAAAIVGMSPWATALDVWLNIQEDRAPGFCERNGYLKPEFLETEQLKWGLAFEDEIVKLARNKRLMDIHFTGENEKLLEMKGREYITCHPDGFYEDGRTLHEGKTTNAMTYRQKWGEPGTDQVPAQYKLQCQHQMMISGASQCIISVLVFPKMVDEFCDLDRVVVENWAWTLEDMGYFHQYVLDADFELHEKLLGIYEKFWNHNVLGVNPPQPTCYDDIKKMCIEPVGTIVVDEQQWRWLTEHKELGEEMSAAKARRDQLKTLILDWADKSGAHPVDKISVNKWVFMSQDGKKLGTWNGKQFR
jgi:putative phage-type endonuclease